MAQPSRSSYREAESKFGDENHQIEETLNGYFDSAPDQFFLALIRVAQEVTDALEGQVWGLDRRGRLSNISTTHSERFRQFECAEIVDQHRGLISDALFSGEIVTSPFRESPGHIPAGQVLWFAPIFIESEAIGVLELIFSADLGPPQNKKLQKLLAIASEYLAKRANPGSLEKNRIQSALEKLQQAPDQTTTGKADSTTVHQPAETSENRPKIDPLDFESLLYLLHNQADLDYVTCTAVNEVRRILRSDRVSLAIKRNGKTDVVAISGQDRVESRSNAVRALQKLGEQVICSGREVSFGIRDEPQTDPMSNSTPGSTVECLYQTGASSLLGIPLYQPEKIDFDSDVHTTDQTVFAALFVEQFSGNPPVEPAELQRVAVHISQATFHSLNREQIFLLPLLRRLGKWGARLKLTRSKAWLAAGLFASAVLLMTIVPVPYHVQATGRLMPAQQFRAYAPFSGEVQEVLVVSGQKVERSQPLLQLHDEQLETRRLILANNHAEKKKVLAAFKAQLDDNSNSISQSERIGLSAKIAQYQLEVTGLQQQIESAEKQFHRSVVSSNIAGTIATFRPEDLLAGRPVSRGELLVEVMNEQGPWQLELRLPEKRLGHLLRSMENSTERPSLTFVQATSPGDSYRGTVGLVSTRTVVESDGSSTVLLNAGIDDAPGLRRTIGAEVTARIDCGNRSLGYVCFGDVIEWLQRRLW